MSVASPFTVFRRNQKIMLAVVGIGAMVAFVFLTPLMSYMSGSAAPANPVVVETNYGNLTVNELESLKYSRELVDRFLRQVTAQFVSNQAARGNLDPRLLDSLVDRQYSYWRQQLMSRSSQGPEQAAVETLVLSKRAEQLGMVISQQAINDKIKEITADSVSSAELQDVIRSLQPSRPVSVARLFEALRTEMLASEYSQLFAQSLRDIPPAQRFEYFSRLNRRAKAELMPLAVGDFVAQAPEPTDAEIKQFYEKFKNDYPNPDSPDPGFKQPRRATFQYFRADIGALTAKLEGEITEEEIRKYYEDNKAQFRAFDFDKDDAASETPAAEPQDQPADDAEKSDAPEKPAAESKPDESKPAPESKPADEPAEEKPAEPKADESKPSSPQAGATRQQAPVRFVSVTAAPDEAPAEEKPAEEKPAEETPADDKPAEETPVEEKPADAKPADDKPAEEKPAEAAPAEEPRFEPLEKVQDTIRTSLARQKAQERITEQFEQLSGEMRRYADDVDIYSTEKGTNPSAKPPVPLDFEALAKDKDVTALELKSVTADQAADEDIGKSFRVVQDQRTGASYTIPFVSFALSERLPTYKSELDQDNENHAFLFWKTDEEPAFVPPLDQIRDKVVLAWKMVKARELARKRAEEFAAQARTLKKPLEELFGGQSKLKITETGPFSWLTLGNVPADPGALPRLSDVEGTDRVGEEFMKAVFALEPAQIGVAMNVPQTTVYVIRLIDFEPSMEELREDFARALPNRYLAAGIDDQRAVFRAWLADLNRDAGVHWLRQADSRRPSDEDQSEGEF
jgi:hypothetical protein